MANPCPLNSSLTWPCSMNRVAPETTTSISFTSRPVQYRSAHGFGHATPLASWDWPVRTFCRATLFPPAQPRTFRLARYSAQIPRHPRAAATQAAVTRISGTLISVAPTASCSKGSLIVVRLAQTSCLARRVRRYESPIRLGRLQVIAHQCPLCQIDGQNRGRV